jgi:enoyl-CoA hydratase/carnithine racemase
MTGNGNEVLVERDGGIAWITLNRPDKLNAMNTALLHRLGEVIDELGADDSARVLIIRGAGRAFSAGYDLQRSESEIAEERTPVQDYDRILGHIRLFERLWDLPKPVIAAVHGYCLAGATQLCIFCDITVVAEDARVGWPSIPVGGGLISPMWSFLIGPKRAKQMSFVAGSQMSGTRSAEWGWANYAVPEEDLWDDVTALARDIAKVPPEILRMKKYSINRVAEVQGFRSAMSMGAETDALLHFSPSVNELQQLIKDKGLKGAISEFQNRDS